MEQTIKCLDFREVDRVPGSLVAPGHRSVVVDHPAREDQLIVGSNDGDHLPVTLHKAVQWAERVGDVGDVIGAVLRHLRIRQRDSRQRNGVPLCRSRDCGRWRPNKWIRVALVDLVPLELDLPKWER
jgi:hypothetical protein